MWLKFGSKIVAYNSSGHKQDEFTLINKFNQYDLKSSDDEKFFSDVWHLSFLLDKNYDFEIVEEKKIPDEVRESLKVLGSFCATRSCVSCPFHKNEVKNDTHCGLRHYTPMWYVRFIKE